MWWHTCLEEGVVLRFLPHTVPRYLCSPLQQLTCYDLEVPVSVACDREYQLHKMDCLSHHSGSPYPTQAVLP